MKRHITFLAICLAWMGSHAQSVNFKVLEDDPYKMKNLSFGLDAFYGEAWAGERFSLGYRFWGIWQVNNKIQAELSMQKPYNAFFDGAYGDAVDGIGVHNKEFDELKPTKWINAVASYNLITDEIYKPTKVVLSSSSYGGWSRTTYITPKATVIRNLMLRGGLYNYNSTIKFGEGEDTNVTTPDGEILYTYGANDAEGNEILYEYNTLHWATSQRAFCVAGGLGWKATRNIRINADGYGNCSNSSIQEFFLDVLFAPAPQIDNVTYGEHTFDVTGGDGGLQTSNLGWRFGYRAYTAKRLLNWGWNAEIGSRPGYKGKGLYLNWGVSIPIVSINIPKLGLNGNE